MLASSSEDFFIGSTPSDPSVLCTTRFKIYIPFSSRNHLRISRSHLGSCRWLIWRALGLQLLNLELYGMVDGFKLTEIHGGHHILQPKGLY